MKRLIWLLAVFSLLQSAMAFAEEEGAQDRYFVVKGGGFFPNGKGPSNDGKANGFKDFNVGYSIDTAIGFKPESYVACELGTGFYSADAERTNVSDYFKYSVFVVPLTLTVKGLWKLGKAELFAGGGVGYYFAFLDINRENNNGSTTVIISENVHGGAFGYHAVVGADMALKKNVALTTEFKWVVAKPDMEETNANGKVAWDMGGAILGIGVKYYF